MLLSYIKIHLHVSAAFACVTRILVKYNNCQMMYFTSILVRHLDDGSKSCWNIGWISGYYKSIFYQCAFVGLGLLYKCKYFLMHGYGKLPHSQVPTSTWPYSEQINSPPPSIELLEYPFEYCPPIYTQFFQVFYFLRIFPPKIYMQLYY